MKAGEASLEKRPDYGGAGTAVKVITNHWMVKAEKKSSEVAIYAYQLRVKKNFGEFFIKNGGFKDFLKVF